MHVRSLTDHTVAPYGGTHQQRKVNLMRFLGYRQLAALALGLMFVVGSVGVARAQTGTTYYVAPTGNNSNDCLSAETPCQTIQAAIGKAAAGDTIQVAAGSYAENITVNKALTLRGAQAGVKATGSDRTGGESIINGTGGSSSFVVTVEADNVTIDGFKVEIRDLARDGINTRTGSPVSPATTAVRSNITLRNNWVYANLPSRTNQVNGIVFGEHTSNTAQSFSAQIANVTIEDNYIGLTTTSSTATAANQSITGARGLVFTNMFRNGGASLDYTGLVVDDNVVYATYQTILQAQLQTRLVGATFTNNLIGNSRSGPSLPTLVSGSIFSNNTIQNINPGADYYSNLAGAYLGVVDSTVANNTFTNIGGTAGLVLAGGRSADPTYFPASRNSTVSGNSFTYNSQAVSSLAGYTSGMLLEPNTVSAAVNVNGWLTGRQAGTTGAQAGTITLSGNTFVNGGSNTALPAVAISQESLGTTLNAVNATPNLFNGTSLTDSSSTADLFTLADRVADRVDATNRGAVLLKAGNVYVTPNSFIAPTTTTPSIQRAIDAATAGDTIQVAPGTYSGNVDVSKAVVITGPNASIAGNGSRNTEAVVSGAVLVNTSNVTIAGLSIDGTNVDQTPDLSKRGVLVGNAAAQSNVTITNNILWNWVTGISLAGGATPGWVQNAVITGNLLVNNGIGSTENATNLTIQNNAFTNGGIGLGAGATMATAITGNTFASGTGRYVSIASGVSLFEGQTLSGILSANTFDKAVALSAAEGQWYSQAIFATIAGAITPAASGATIQVAPGTYSENLTINKRLTITGAGSGSDPVSNTIITSAAANTPVISVTGSGVDTTNRLRIANLRVTGASGTIASNNTSGILLTFSTAGVYRSYTFDNVTSVGNAGFGIGFNGGAKTVEFRDIEILNSRFENNSHGIRFGSSLTLDGLLVDNSIVSNNGFMGLSINPSINPTASFAATNIVIEDTLFNQNGGSTFSGSQLGNGDISLTGFNGNATLRRVTVNGRPADSAAHLGIQFRGQATSGTSTAPFFPAGTIVLDDVTITGAYRRPSAASSLPGAQSYAIYFQNYSDLSGISFNDVEIANTLAGNGLGTGGLTGTLNLGNTAFSVPTSTIYGSTTAYSIQNFAIANITATSATFDGLNKAVAADNFAIADRIIDWVDLSGVGVVTFSAGNIYVTPNSFIAPTTTTPSIQRAIDAASTGSTINVAAGTYTEDVNINKTLYLRGAGYATTTVSGVIGGDSATMRVAAPGVIIDGFTITRQGNNVTDWNNSGLNSAGVGILGQTVNAEVRNSRLFGNRTGIDINNSNGNNIHNNLIEHNRTGLILRNQTDNTILSENTITDNWTVGVLFLDASNGSNNPLQQAVGSSFTNNAISGNWYGEVVDRQSGGALPATGTLLKNFECNWFGSATAPAVTTANSTEPGYADQIPVIFGGSAVAPTGTMADILGAASANIDFVNWLISGTDNDTTVIGFQPAAGTCVGSPVQVFADSSATTPQSGHATIQEAVNAAAAGNLIVLQPGFTHNGTRITVDKNLTINGNGQSINAGFDIVGGADVAISGLTIANISTASTAGFSSQSDGTTEYIINSVIDGKLTLTNVTMNQTLTTGGNFINLVGVNVRNTGELVMNSSTLNLTNESHVYAVYSQSGGPVVTISNTTFNPAITPATMSNRRMVLVGHELAADNVQAVITLTNNSYTPTYSNATRQTFYEVLLYAAPSTLTNSQINSYLSSILTSGQRAYVWYGGGSQYYVYPGPVVNTTKGLHYATIQAAIADAAAGDEIQVAPGTYLETINLNKANLTLRSTGGAAVTTLRGGGGSGDADAVVRFGANGVTLEGFTIDRNNPTADSRAIAPMASSGATIRNNTIINARRGIQGDFYGRPTNLTIQGNTFQSSVQYGIAGTEDMTSLSISGNTFRTTVEGIGLGVGVGLGTVTVDQLFAAQTWQLPSGYAIKDYRVSGEPISGAPYLAIPTNLAISQGARNSSLPAGVELGTNIPVSLYTNSHAIGAVAFSLDLSGSCVSVADPATAVQLAPGQATAAQLFATLNNGDLDIAILSDTPLTNGLLLNVQVSYSSSSSCLNPTDGVTAVNFVTDDPAPSFSSLVGLELTAGTSQNGSIRPRWGDCNNDGNLNAADISSCILEIFDRDGTARTDARYGTATNNFLGTIFCDSNQDTIINAGDIVCTVRRINNLVCSASVAATSSAVQPARLTTGSALSTNGKISIPISYTANGNAAAAALFALQINPAFTFDPTNADGDGLPDALRLSLPTGFQATAFYDAEARLLQVSLIALTMPMTTLSDGQLGTLDLTMLGNGAPVESAVSFQDVSLGSVNGESLPVQTGSNQQLSSFSRIYLPVIRTR